MSARKAASLDASLLVRKGGAAPAGALDIPPPAEVEDEPAQLEFEPQPEIEPPPEIEQQAEIEPQPLSQESVSGSFSAWRAAAAIAVLVVSGAAILYWQQTENTRQTASAVDATSPIVESTAGSKDPAVEAEKMVAQPASAITSAPNRVEIAGPEKLVESATGQDRPVAAQPPPKPAVQTAKFVTPSQSIQSTNVKNTDATPSSGQTATPPPIVVASPADLAKQKPVRKELAKPKYVIQLSAVKSVSNARREASRLKRRLGGLLKGKELQVQKAVARGRGTIYRVNLAEFSNRSGASKLCARIKSRSFDCVVKKR